MILPRYANKLLWSLILLFINFYFVCVPEFIDHGFFLQIIVEKVVLRDVEIETPIKRKNLIEFIKQYLGISILTYGKFENAEISRMFKINVRK